MIGRTTSRLGLNLRSLMMTDWIEMLQKCIPVFVLICDAYESSNFTLQSFLSGFFCLFAAYFRRFICSFYLFLPCHSLTHSLTHSLSVSLPLSLSRSSSAAWRKPSKAVHVSNNISPALNLLYDEPLSALNLRRRNHSHLNICPPSPPLSQNKSVH